MALNAEWRAKIEQWRDAIGRMIYVKLADVPLTGFKTFRQLAIEEATAQTFARMPAGKPWGAKWEYAWLRARVELPPRARGKKIVFRCGESGSFTVNPGGEGRFIVNGRDAGACDWAHPEVLLTPKGAAGKCYDVLIELYAGHGPTPCGSGPVLDEESGVPEPPEHQKTIPAVSFGIWEEEAFQAWVDLQTLLDVRDCLDPDSLRVSKIDDALRDFCVAFDPELPAADRIGALREARAVLAPALDCRNGSTAPEFYCFGHSHIDVAWLWPLAETERKCARTFGAQLALIDQYPEFVFFQSQPHLYRMTKRLYPELYGRIQKAVRDGRWQAEGGMWVECDTNVAGGEAMIRQFIHGKRFFKDEFGVASELMWLPDVFGYSGALPQIMAGCGIKYFSTQKISWNYNSELPMKVQTFWWEGIDGTRVFTHLHQDYNSPTTPARLIKRWSERFQKDGIDARMIPFGWGDGGGGPTRQHLEFLRRQKDLEGAPRCRIAGPVDFCKDELKKPRTLPVFVGELYFQAHRGTYTSQARVKRGNRKCELALREMELWGVAASALAGKAYPLEKADELWKGVLLNQFHDILPGSSIHRVYEEAEALHQQVLRDADQESESSRQALTKPGPGAVTVFNSLSWPRPVLVPLPKGVEGAEAGGRPLTVQTIGRDHFAEVTVPACGWTSLRAAPAAAAPVAGPRATARSLENEFIRAAFNEQGEIVSLLDKETGAELAAAPMNRFRLFKDVPRAYDAWDIDSNYELFEVPLTGKAAIEVVTEGPLAAVLRITRKISRSRLTQEVWLRRGSRRLDFKTVVDWQEKHRLLKVAFPTGLHAQDALHDIQFGHLARPGHRSLPFDADRFEVCNQKWTAVEEGNRGAAVLNDCKYGVNVIGGAIQLTLLRSPKQPDATADMGLQEFTYSFYAWNGPFFQSGVVREAYDLNVPAGFQPGTAVETSLFQVDAPNVVIEAVKPAEDGSGDCIVRLYESKHAQTECVLMTALSVARAVRTNMLEEAPSRPLAVRKGAMSLSFKPFEIITLRLTLGRLL
jgi:alpha-mannosidase